MMVRHRNPSRRVHSRPHPTDRSSFYSLRPQSHRSPPILTEVPSNPYDHIMVPHRSPKNKRRSLHSRRHPIHGSLNVPIEHHPTIRYMVYNGYNIPKMGPLPTPAIPTEVPQKFFKQCLFLWLPSIPLSPKASYTDRSSFWPLRPQWSHIGAQLYWHKFLLILATTMVPHRSPINTSRLLWWLQSRLHPIQTEVPQKFLKQCLFLWLPSTQSLPKHPQKFPLFFATVMVPHRSPTNTSRREQSHPHPSATFPSNAFPSDTLLFHSFPKHRNWQKLLLILATIMVPHRSPSTGRSCF